MRLTGLAQIAVTWEGSAPGIDKRPLGRPRNRCNALSIRSIIFLFSRSGGANATVHAHDLRCRKQREINRERSCCFGLERLLVMVSLYPQSPGDLIAAMATSRGAMSSGFNQC
jgi:hypothetical protein